MTKRHHLHQALENCPIEKLSFGGCCVDTHDFLEICRREFVAKREREAEDQQGGDHNDNGGDEIEI